MELESGYQALQVWDQQAVASAPMALKVWLGLMGVSVAFALLFIKRSGARYILTSVVLGLLVTKFIAPFFALTIYSGFVALTHVCCWPLGLYGLWRDGKGRSVSKSYFVWSIWISLIFFISLIFDVRDAFKYLFFLLF